MTAESLKAEIARRYGTPAVVIDLDVVERNIARLQSLCDTAGIANRPHIKTHKSPVLAAMQIAAGAKGITCQKLGEAEVMADGGMDDILISYNILGEEKTGRLGALAGRVKMTVSADNPIVVDGLPRAAGIAGRPLDVLVECDTGRKRAGVETPSEAVALAKHIAAQPGLTFAGFLIYPPETARPRDAALPRYRDERPARGRPRRECDLIGRHAEPAASVGDQRRHRAPLGDIDLQ